MNLLLRILIVGAFLLFATPVFAKEFSRCDDCHAQTLERDRVRFYQHQPFAQQECQTCHAVAEEVASPTPEPAGAAKGLDRRRIAWLAESPVVAQDHAFLLPADQLGDVLIVEARSEDGDLSQAEVAVPMLVEITTVPDEGRSPLIRDVQVLEVRRGIFLSVTIGWNTDTLTNARVVYGLGEMSQSARSGDRYGLRHQVVLNQLQPGKTYNFRVVSRDLYGHEEESTVLTFSTAKAIDRSQPAKAFADRRRSEVADKNFWRRGSDYLLTLQFDQPATVFVGRQGAVRDQVVTVINRAGAAVAGEADGAKDVHADLSSGAVLTIASCRSCHQRQTSATHPVGVFPKAGMVIPPEYPTLPDGRISCISCHAVHGSNNEYLARKPGKRELCVGCHEDML